jgi:uncharacterized membrane protein
MAFAEHEVLIRRDAMAVYLYLLDATNLPLWRDGVHRVKLVDGSEGAKGAVYRQMVAGRSGLSIPADLEITSARPGAEIQFQVVAGPARPHGGYYLSTEGTSTRVRFALESRPKGLAGLMDFMIQRTMKSEVAQLERLKEVLEARPAEP